MPRDPESKRRVVEAIGDAIRLLQMAERSIDRAQHESSGNLRELASRMSRQMQFLQEVAEVACHEIERQSAPEAPVRPRLGVVRP